MDHPCELCHEFRTRTCAFLPPPRERFLFENDDFVIFPALGSFVEGYLLICPKTHVPSCAALDLEFLVKLEDLLAVTRSILRAHYGPSIAFEHGLASLSRRAGGCIDHAHLHIVPAALDVRSILTQEFGTHELVRLSDLVLWRGHAYLLAQNNDGSGAVCDVPDHLPSQFLRRRIATALNLEERWDWGAYLGLTEIRRTLDRLYEDFQRTKL
jgi:diadenosine tetraphosphate (Ap4A) HIT family hydrolase